MSIGEARWPDSFARNSAEEMELLPQDECPVGSFRTQEFVKRNFRDRRN
jgi:hypothetical protein